MFPCDTFMLGHDRCYLAFVILAFWYGNNFYYYSNSYCYVYFVLNLNVYNENLQIDEDNVSCYVFM